MRIVCVLGVMRHSMATVQTLKDRNKWTDSPTLRQNQKRCNATRKPTHSCFTFAFVPTHQRQFSIQHSFLHLKSQFFIHK